MKKFIINAILTLAMTTIMLLLNIVEVYAYTSTNDIIYIPAKSPCGVNGYGNVVEKKILERPLDKEDASSDYYILAHLLEAEAGSDWCSYEMRLYVGSVALNRVKSDKYPDNLLDVVFDNRFGVQYQCTINGAYFNKNPSDLSWQIAEELVKNGSALPDNVIYQAEFTQGSGIYKKVQNMYFCYE